MMTREKLLRIQELLELLERMAEDSPRCARRTHAHRCKACGNVFSHGEDCAGITEAHMCPWCGNGPWWPRTTEPGG